MLDHGPVISVCTLYELYKSNVNFVENCNDTCCSYKACVLRVCYIMHAYVWVFRDLSCDLAGGLSYTKWPLDVRSLGHRDAIVRDSCLVHTLWYDRARPRPRLSDRAGVSLCKGYDTIDSMVEATCL